MFRFRRIQPEEFYTKPPLKNFVTSLQKHQLWSPILQAKKIYFSILTDFFFVLNNLHTTSGFVTNHLWISLREKFQKFQMH